MVALSHPLISKLLEPRFVLGSGAVPDFICCPTPIDQFTTITPGITIRCVSTAHPVSPYTRSVLRTPYHSMPQRQYPASAVPYAFTVLDSGYLVGH
eukprot:748496-Rhodomonas_salina.2